MAIDEMYLENLEEFVFDEDKIVTYKWLSRSLAVHVNAAKQMLYSFVDHQRNKKDVDSLNVTYLVCGVKGEDKGNITHHVEIVGEERLNAVKSTYKQITSCHVYSVQKSKLKDSNALYMVDYELLKTQIFNSNQYSAITCKLAKPRSRDEIAKLQSTSVVASRQEEPPNKSTSKQTNGTSKAKPKGLVGMFGKAAEKKKDDSVVETEKTKSPEKKEPESKGKGKMGATSFFGKSSTAKTMSKPAQEAAPAPPEVKKETTITATKGKKTVRVESDDDDEVQQIKRRRIKAWESSSEEEDIESPVPSPPPSPTPMEEQDPTPTKEPSPVKIEVVEKTVPSGGGDGKQRRVRKRKLVPKTYMDDKGYMVTEKVWESDSTDASEVEEIVPPPQSKPKQQESKAGKKKTASPPKKTKQASLMSFFGKK
ncbi:DNA polymerase delta subunit 3-like isoform X2 [Lineus longissimus]|uniref:DNA polymerase delta subunit 3-like isoform X2 n=1 Tax=Lineus longissimus TaxID=88925 RepID=UPI00315D95E2